MKTMRWLTVIILLVMSGLPPIVRSEPGALGKPLIIDVRTEPEWREGHLEGALLIPYDTLGARIERVAPDKKAKVLLYCRSGRRSGIGLDTLKQLGYEDVTNLGSVTDAAEKLQLRIVQ